MKIYSTKQGVVVEDQDRWYSSDLSIDELVVRDNLKAFLETTLPKLRLIDRSVDDRPQALMAPIESQEVWAAGVTYHRSRNAR